MSDHIVSSSAISRVIQSKSKDSLLLVDTNISKIFDIDDATKVNAKDGKILDIGKEIPTYNCIDCGIFRLDSRFFNAMRIQMQNNQDSISAGIQVLIKNGDMSVVYTKDNDYWLDIDTPDAYFHAQKNLSNLI